MIFLYLLNDLNLPAHFVNFVSSKHKNINVTVEQKNISSLSSLEVKVCHENSKFVIRVHRKSTCSGVFTNGESFIPKYQKRGLLYTLLHRSFSIFCEFKTFHFKIYHLKTILMKNNYPPNSTDSCIKTFFKKLYTPKVIVRDVPKRNIFC